MNVDVFLGLTKKAAQDKAEAMNLIFRLISVDGESYFPIPGDNDVRTDRICVEIEKTKVTKCWVQ